MRVLFHLSLLAAAAAAAAPSARQRVSINAGWKFSRFTDSPDSLSYGTTLKPWILPSANAFIVSGTKHPAPSGTPPGAGVPYVQTSFDDSQWESVKLPHDWAVKGPFNAPGISGGMGRLPSNGVGWYRRTLAFTAEEAAMSIFLDVDGAMSYATVWLNGNLVGGWPYGYASFRLDLTAHVKVGPALLAIRVENGLDNSRFYAGAGIYRNLWLVKANKTHVAQYGTYITTPAVSASSATVHLAVELENLADAARSVHVVTEIRTVDGKTGSAGNTVAATFPPSSVQVPAHGVQSVNATVTLANPLLWGPPPGQRPNLYVAVTTVYAGASGEQTAIDTYETRFGVRSITYDGDKGLLVNGKAVRVQGTNNHHDQGSLGAAFHYRAAERQLEMLQEMGCNALRTSHNPPAPELLDLADAMGFVVLDEIFDCWATGKTSNDFHLIFADWHEADLRSFVRRDRNHPSVIGWSIGNEIPEEGNGAGAAQAQSLRDMVTHEDPTRPTTASMPWVGPGSAFANVMAIESLNYQGEGAGTSPGSSFPAFHSQYPDKMIWSTESASTVSSRGTYLFPVEAQNAAVVGNGAGGDEANRYVSAYELYAPPWATSPDKVFSVQDKYPFVAGEFVWTGWDYLGEPTPYDASRSSYFGIIDLAGFKKDRFYLYQARWRPDLAVAHILPHWTWPDRLGQVTPVHVFSGADEAELFVNGASQGRLKRASSTWRFRWDQVVYSPGSVRVVTYTNGRPSAVDTRRTVGPAQRLNMTADRTTIQGDGADLSFIAVAVVDAQGETVPRADNSITFSITGPAQVVATDNGDPTDMTVFPSLTRKAFSGLALAVVRSNPGGSGQVVVSAAAPGLAGAQVNVQVAAAA